MPFSCLLLPAAAAALTQDASKARESRLRKAGLQGRARMASELRDMDNDIAALSKALAVRLPSILVGVPASQRLWFGVPSCLPSDVAGLSHGLPPHAGMPHACPCTTLTAAVALPCVAFPPAGAHAAARDGVCVWRAGG